MSAWRLPALMMLGAVLGLIAGGTLGARWADPGFEPVVLVIRGLGVVFISALKALIVPLVVTSIIAAVTGIGDIRRLGRAASVTAVYFLSTTFIAVLTGMVLVSLIDPGVGAAMTPNAAAVAQIAAKQTTAARAIYDVVTGMFPPNLIAAAAEGNVLGLIVFSLALGVTLSAMGDRTKAVVEVISGLNEALLQLVRVLVWLAPIGIFGLVADRLGRAGGGSAVWAELTALAWYALTVMLGLLVHGAITIPLILRVMTRRSPVRYAAGMTDALITAFGTASSAATMAVTLRCATEKNGVGKRASELVIPLGTTVNMDGTALYEAVAVIFIAQTLSIDLSISQQILIALTATLAAIGAAAIPEAGLVTMVLVLGAVGLPAEGIGLLLSIDWILDRFRTTVNVWGDSVGAALVDRVLVESTPRVDP